MWRHRFALFNKIDETVSLGNLQKLRLAFEVKAALFTATLTESASSSLEDLTVFVFVKEFETGGLRSIDVKNFGRIVKKCLALPETVRQCVISLYILFSVRFSHLCTLSHFFAIKTMPLQTPD